MLRQRRFSFTPSESTISFLPNLMLKCCLALLLLSQMGFADEVPAWLRQAASVNCGPIEKHIPAIVLWDEARVKVESDGRIKTVRYYALRINNREGRPFAVASEAYPAEAGKMLGIKAWLIRPSGALLKYDKKDVLEGHASPNDLYNEVMVKSISAASEAEVGDVFGYEVSNEEQPVFWQFEWMFQERFPTLLSRYAITLPDKWKLNSVTFNRSAITPILTGNTYTWELRDLPAIEPEPNSPPLSALAPRLGISVFPSSEAKGNNSPSFANWAEVSQWLHSLSEAQAVPNDALAAKARDLTAFAKTEWERIQAISRYVQGIRYVSIQTGLGRGGGYRPHLATEVFAKGYGDCKDKANLMRAMLKAVGIASHLVSVYSGDATFVRAEWPTPQQFNHCIIAISVSDNLQATSLINHARLGRLLIFDPTDSYTPVGELPEDEQDSLALIVANEAGTLERMPVAPTSANRVERRIEVTLSAEGTLTAKVWETSYQQSAVQKIALYQSLSRTEYQQTLEAMISQKMTGAKVSNIKAQEQKDGSFCLELELLADNYAQNSRGNLLIFKPLFWGLLTAGSATTAARQQPFLLAAKSFTETIAIKLPLGFAVDELLESKIVEAPFGKYSVTAAVKDGRLFVTREFTLQKASIPAYQDQEVTKFFSQIQVLEQTPVVLVKP
ncbi:MAG: DUF3857 domain-containing protein [Acidobacteria bacterium]|nr:DUF3857 domain-containing protein [Acidobacteriota bacterium]